MKRLVRIYESGVTQIVCMVTRPGNRSRLQACLRYMMGFTVVEFAPGRVVLAEIPHVLPSKEVLCMRTVLLVREMYDQGRIRIDERDALLLRRFVSASLRTRPTAG